MTEQENLRNWNQQRIFYAIFAIIVVIGIFFLADEYLDTKKENKILGEAVIANQALAEYRLTSISILNTQLNECRKLNG